MPTTFRYYEELKDVLGCTPTVESVLQAVNKYRRTFIAVENMEAGGMHAPLQGEKYEEHCQFFARWLKEQQTHRTHNSGE